MGGRSDGNIDGDGGNVHRTHGFLWAFATCQWEPGAVVQVYGGVSHPFCKERTVSGLVGPLHMVRTILDFIWNILVRECRSMQTPPKSLGNVVVVGGGEYLKVKLFPRDLGKCNFCQHFAQD